MSRAEQSRAEQSRAEQSRARIAWLDYARMIAIVCVVITHTTETVYQLNVESLIQYSLYQRIFAISMFTIGRLGVPIFFFLTGYLLLDRKYSGEHYKAFLKKNFCGLLLTTEIWIIVYNIFNAMFWNAPFDMEKCLKNLLFLKPTEMGHMWYMPVIIGIYLFIPFIANALNNTDIKIFCAPLIFVFSYRFIVPVVNVWLTANGQEPVYALPDLSFSGNEYGFMILLGYLVKKGIFDRIHSLALAIFGTAGFVFTVFIQNYSDMHGISYNVWYDCSSLLIADLSIFVLLSRMNLKPKKAVESISKASFGIYLIHNLILIPLGRYYQSGMSSVSRLTVIFSVTFLAAWTLASIIGKIEPLAKFLLFQKSSKQQGKKISLLWNAGSQN